ncbi:MAG: DUF1499 domain-containing protein [Gammaproteobacteria bacterium]
MPRRLLLVIVTCLPLLGSSFMVHAKPDIMIPTALRPCPSAPHCVSTEAQKPSQHMVPIRYNGRPEAAQERLRKIIKKMPRTVITADVPGYVAVEFKSRLFGFVDDVEFLFDPDNSIIRFRSSAHVGYYDFGVNRARMKAITVAFQTDTGAD